MVETKRTTEEETTSNWLDLPVEVAELEEKLGVGAESGEDSIIEKVLPYADEVHEHTSVYQLNKLDFMYRQLSSAMQEEYVSLLMVFDNLNALYICRNVITVYPDCIRMINVERQKLMTDTKFKTFSRDCSRLSF
ncbi:antirestriction protein, partial [Clostridioides difficile]|uniref:antirestriction protein n=1 Tax=Clostridioides difficile TaxID=1496 RepID=UPI000BC72B08